RNAGLAERVGTHLLVRARHPAGYARLARMISAAQMRGHEKGKPLYNLSELAQAHDGHWMVLTGCRKGTVPSALLRNGPAVASRALADLVALFGQRNVAVELW